ncbi:hypothetical protein BDR03DRAFT_58973 [Suillus americanus]|nr:hypothetical protein BDR03DRAFT_58973 [Suillus americanus]
MTFCAHCADLHVPRTILHYDFHSELLNHPDSSNCVHLQSDNCGVKQEKENNSRQRTSCPFAQ